MTPFGKCVLMAVTRSAEDTQTGLVALSKTWLVACMQLKHVHALFSTSP